ncbi:MAG: hypothetical protein Crog4KO_00290 [Crocinitomicaceae bacterium]
MRYLLLFSLTLLLNSLFAQDTATVENSTYEIGDTIGPIQVRFPLGDDQFGNYTVETMRPIDSVIQILEANPTIHVEIAEHTEARGTAENNLKFSENRAKHIKDLMIYEGISEDRLTAKGYGEDQPILEEKYINQFRKTDREKFERLHQRNRRTLFIVTEN